MKNLTSKIIAVWKPVGPTSHDIIDSLRRQTGIKTIGHAGTLDPLAEGILVVGIGQEATRKLAEVVAKEKEYVAEIKLGETTETYDAESPRTPRLIAKIPDRPAVKQALQKFIGQISQTPPPYSAIKVAGQPAYRLARTGRPPRLKPRPVEIKKITLIAYRWPIVKVRVITGPGVYIRSLAYDLGQTLGTDGYLKSLIRTRVGEFTKRHSHILKNVRMFKKVSSEQVPRH